MAWFERVDDLRAGTDTLRRRPYGVIMMRDERLAAVWLRPWPKWIVGLDVPIPGTPSPRREQGNRCWLYYNQPWRHRRFLVLKYVVSSRQATLATFHGALVVLDEIARIKQSDAILCEARNPRISDRLLRRWGWQPHFPSSRRRHFIKRLYGQYSDPRHAWALARSGEP
jgi:hypothetical protein